MYSIYILLSKRDGRLYVGCTSDVDERIIRHNNGHVKATKFRRPLELIYKEEFVDKSEAFSRERFFKSLWSGKIKKKILKDYMARLAQRESSPDSIS